MKFEPIMTAADLIKRLQKMDPATAIVLMDKTNGYFFALGVAELDVSIRKPKIHPSLGGDLIASDVLPDGSKAKRHRAAFIGLINERRST